MCSHFIFPYFLSLELRFLRFPNSVNLKVFRRHTKLLALAGAAWCFTSIEIFQLHSWLYSNRNRISMTLKTRFSRQNRPGLKGDIASRWQCPTGWQMAASSQQRCWRTDGSWRCEESTQALSWCPRTPLTWSGMPTRCAAFPFLHVTLLMSRGSPKVVPMQNSQREEMSKLRIWRSGTKLSFS